VLMIDHTFVFAPSVNTLAAIIRSGEIGNLLFAESTRTNLARFDAIGVIRDLAVHDIAIFEHVLGRRPITVSARRPRIGGEPEEIAFMAFRYSDGLIAHVPGKR